MTAASIAKSAIYCQVGFADFALRESQPGPTLGSAVGMRMDMEARRPVGPVFKRLRKQKGLTLDKVASAVAWDGPNLSRSERGLQELTERRLYQLSAFFGIRPSDAYALAESGMLDRGAEGAEVITKLIALIGDMDRPQRKQMLDFAEFLANQKK